MNPIPKNTPPFHIELEEWQSAEPRKCGSCHYFRRSGGIGGDWCNFNLPEWVVERDDPNRQNQRSMMDTATCDLWRPKSIDGQIVIFQKMKKWPADAKD